MLRSRRAAVTALLAALLVAGSSGAVGAGSPPTSPLREVIVRAHDDAGGVAELVQELGGRVGVALPLVDGFAASVPADRLEALAADSRVAAVTPDEEVTVSGGLDETADRTLKSVYADETGAALLHGEGVTGAGVRVALIDTGVTPVPDLDDRLVTVKDPASGERDVACINFSGEPSCDDTYGHGTFIAGLIAGTGESSGGRFRGVAPGAEIVSVKIAGADGSADVSKVLAAIQWVVSFRQQYGIKVLNLSLGTNSRNHYELDPLNFAVQRAWRSGITVVVSASNRGPDAGTISKPADDPLVITVGAVDDRETKATSDDRLPSFSGRGPTAHGLAKPDVVAPGGRLVSLRSPGSTIEQRTGNGGEDAYRRGSGTSMSAGVVSGLIALMHEANAGPPLTPDRIKFALMATASKVAARDPLAVGAGLVNAHAAIRSAPSGLANGGITTLSDASAPLDSTRADVIVTRPCTFPERLLGRTTCPIRGDETANGGTWDDDEYRGEWDGSSWYGSSWYGSSWYGSSWYGSSWYGSSWYQNTWEGSSWYGSSWYGDHDPSTSYGTSLAGSSWYGAWG